MKKLVAVIVVLVAAAALVTGAAIAAQKNDRPWVGENGVWDMSQAPETQTVVDSTGIVVGVAMTEDVLGDEGVYPHPVYSLDDHSVQVGWLGRHGYWAIGQPEAWCAGCTSRTESLGENGSSHVITDTYNADRTITRVTEVTDENGNTTTVEQITEGTEGGPGSTGNANN